MNKSLLVALLATSILATHPPAQAQQPGKIFRIGVLDPSTASGSAILWNAFRQELGKLGWSEGKNVAIEYRFAENKSERVPELAAELVRLKVDLIVTSGNPPALEAKKATTTIPIVMTSIIDPVALGLVDSLARPGGNVTGLHSFATELNTKRLEILKDAVPKLARVGLLVRQAGNPGEELQIKELRVAASALKVKLEEIKTELDTQGFESAFKTAKQKQVGAIMTTSLRVFSAERKPIVALAAKSRLPAIYGSKESVDEGGLMSYGEDVTDRYLRAAGYVDKILKGTIPVQQAMKFEFVINLKAAKQINLTIPPEVLARANRVIQ